MTELYFMCGYILGLLFPDFDIYFQETLGHRSIIFHSLFLPLFFLIVFKKINLHSKIYITGLFYGISTHLIADLFPLIWNNKTFIRLPLDLIVLSKFHSILWLFVNSLIGFVISLNHLKKFKKIFFNFSKLEVIGFLLSLIYFVLHADNYIKVGALLLITIFLIKIYKFLIKKIKTH